MCVCLWLNVKTLLQQKFGRTTGISFSTPEVKIFFIFCYLLVFMVVLWTTFSIDNGRFDVTLSYMHDYINCMSGGRRKDLDCEEDRRKFIDRGVPSLQITYLILYSFLTFSNLPFIIQFQSVKVYVSRKVSMTSNRSLSKTSLSKRSLSMSSKKSSVSYFK